MVHATFEFQNVISKINFLHNFVIPEETFELVICYWHAIFFMLNLIYHKLIDFFSIKHINYCIVFLMKIPEGNILPWLVTLRRLRQTKNLQQFFL